MPLSGGPADKVGNRYEGRWTVSCLARVMDEQAHAIRLEPPGEDGDGVEFWMRMDGKRQYHQVKRQQANKGGWSLSDMEGSKKRVLSRFWTKLQDPVAECVFVSTQDAFQLHELADRARSSQSWPEYQQEFLKSNQQSTNFSQLCTHWDGCSQPVAYEALKRVFVETVSEDVLRTLVENQIKPLVEGEAVTVADILAQFALDQVHQELTAHRFWQHLEERGFRRRNWGHDSHVLAAVADATQCYLTPLLDEAINGQVIVREETEAVVGKLASPTGKRGVLLVGEAGGGKSTTALQVVNALQARGWPILAFRVDRLSPTQLPEAIGHQLGLPGSPAHVLAAVSQHHDCALVIDQLDALSLVSGRHPEFFDGVNQVIRQAQSYPRMRLLLSCRRFDLDNDQRLRRLTEQNGVAEAIPVSRLSVATVRKVVSALGLEADRLSARQFDLLSVPLHLKLLAEVAQDGGTNTLGFETAKDLFDRFWDYKQQVICVRTGRPLSWARVVDALCDSMSQQQTLSVPESVLDEFAADARAMASDHVLVKDRGRFAFFHESFFDYAFARRFTARRLELLPLLLGSEQHLFRRAQVRQILIYEREMNRPRYLSDLSGLLMDPGIRFHIKKVVFALLGQLPDPAPEEWSVLAPLVLDSPSFLASEVWGVLHGSAAWVQLLTSTGVIQNWLKTVEAQ